MSEYGKYTPDFDNEDECQEWLESFFEKKGWTAIREVSPHGESVRADLIVRHEDHGWVGVEVKYLDSSDCGGAIGDAIQQVYNKYHGKKYIGNRINVWCVAPYYRVEHMSHHGQESRTRNFVNSFNLGYLSLGKSKLMMNFKANVGTDWRLFVGNAPSYPGNRDESVYSDYGEYEKIAAESAQPPI